MGWMIMPLRRYADFRGRSQRVELWMWVLFCFLITIALVTLDNMLGLGGTHQIGRTAGTAAGNFSYGVYATAGLLTWIFWLLVLIPHLAVQVRRLHDSDRSGWWVLMPFAPFLVTLLVLLIGAASRSITMMLIGGLFFLLSFGGVIALIVLYCLEGTRGVNRYGPDPRDPDGAADLADVFG